MRSESGISIEELEISLLLEAVHRHFGYDLRAYRPQPLRKRLKALLKAHGLATISALQEKVLHDAEGMAMLLKGVLQRPSVLMREGGHMKVLRQAMVPWLSSCAAPRIWVADCVAPEDVFALSMLIEEEKLGGKCEIFATAPHDALVDEIAEGRFAAGRLEEYEAAYRASGGERRISDYCSVNDGECIFGDAVRNNVTFAEYNLSTDASFNEFHLIVYPSGIDEFTDVQRGRAVKLFNESLSMFGMLDVGKLAPKQDVPRPTSYRTLSDEHSLYLRVS